MNNTRSLHAVKVVVVRSWLLTHSHEIKNEWSHASISHMSVWRAQNNVTFSKFKVKVVVVRNWLLTHSHEIKNEWSHASISHMFVWRAQNNVTFSKFKVKVVVVRSWLLTHSHEIKNEWSHASISHMSVWRAQNNVTFSMFKCISCVHYNVVGQLKEQVKVIVNMMIFEKKSAHGRKSLSWAHWSYALYRDYQRTVIPRLTSDPDNGFFRLTKIFSLFFDSANECFSGCAP